MPVARKGPSSSGMAPAKNASEGAKGQQTGASACSRRLAVLASCGSLMAAAEAAVAVKSEIQSASNASGHSVATAAGSWMMEAVRTARTTPEPRRVDSTAAPITVMWLESG